MPKGQGFIICNSLCTGLLLFSAALQLLILTPKGLSRRLYLGHAQTAPYARQRARVHACGLQVKTASDFNDAIASSPSFAAMLAHLPSDPSLLLRSGSLGSLQLLQGSGGSANAALLAELQALAAANDTATPLDLGTDMVRSSGVLSACLCAAAH